jgi:hypothetical protein
MSHVHGVVALVTEHRFDRHFAVDVDCTTGIASRHHCIDVIAGTHTVL